MISYYFEKVMMWIGYRKVYYFPTRHFFGVADYHKWEYLPKSEKKYYNEDNVPREY